MNTTQKILRALIIGVSAGLIFFFIVAKITNPRLAVSSIAPAFLGVAVVASFLYSYVSMSPEKRKEPKVRQTMLSLVITSAIVGPLLLLFMLTLAIEPRGNDSIFDPESEACMINCDE